MGNGCGVRGVCGAMSRGSDIIGRTGKRLSARFHKPRVAIIERGHYLFLQVDGLRESNACIDVYQACRYYIAPALHLHSTCTAPDACLSTSTTAWCARRRIPNEASFELNPILGLAPRLQGIGRRLSQRRCIVSNGALINTKGTPRRLSWISRLDGFSKHTNFLITLAS